MPNIWIIVAVQLVGFVVVWFAANAIGERNGKRQALIELRDDLNQTVMEWNRRALAGDVVRSLELPGIHAVVRMLYDETDRQLDSQAPNSNGNHSLRILQ